MEMVVNCKPFLPKEGLYSLLFKDPLEAYLDLVSRKVDRTDENRIDPGTVCAPDIRKDLIPEKQRLRRGCPTLAEGMLIPFRGRLAGFLYVRNSDRVTELFYTRLPVV